ncbi:MAG: hypothetical protein KGL95_15660, partial [Patescibacteria group bacterium]|nr:hypothetical protein [Patescibacteria group bacterium]
MKRSYKRTTVIVLLISFIYSAKGQNIGINTTGATPDPSALLDISGSPLNDKGLLIPRMTTAQMNAITSPADGLVIFNTDCQVFDYWNGTAWIPFPSTAAAPGTPGAITGTASVCSGATGVSYSISAVTNAT